VLAFLAASGLLPATAVRPVSARASQPELELVPLEAPDGSIKANFISFGAAVQSLWVKDRSGAFRDIVLGYDNLTNYITLGPTGQSHPYFGPVVGRYANRIKNGTFSIPISANPNPNSKNTFHLVENENNGEDTLHGGKIGYDLRTWSILEKSQSSVTFQLVDPNGFQGFPGTVISTVTYTLQNHANWHIQMHSTADSLTPIMLSSHVYWNLEAYKESQDLNATFVQFDASRIIATDGILIPTGKLTDIDDTPANFHVGKSLGKAIGQTVAGEFCGTNCVGFDNCWIYDAPQSKTPLFSIWNTNSGIKLDVTTDQIALQVYTCNGVASPVAIPRKKDQGGPSTTYADHSCLVIEQESWIDAINNPNFGINQIFGPERDFNWESTYAFSTIA